MESRDRRHHRRAHRHRRAGHRPHRRTLRLDPMNALVVPPDIEALLAQNAPIAVGVSGGKDSVACALAVADYLRDRDFAGPKILVHADLGLVEWSDSLPACRRVAERIGWELHV